MSKTTKKITKEKNLEFNTYCIFTENKQDITQTISLIFKDYIKNLRKTNRYIKIIYINKFKHFIYKFNVSYKF